jgi:hypothetical protein
MFTELNKRLGPEWARRAIGKKKIASFQAKFKKTCSLLSSFLLFHKTMMRRITSRYKHDFYLRIWLKKVD